MGFTSPAREAVLTGRTRHGLLTIPAAIGPDGVPQVADHPWDTRRPLAIVRQAAGTDARLVAHSGPERFDVLNLLVATDGAVAKLGTDVRRLRPNLLIGGVPADAEQNWPGHAFAIGDALIGVHSMRQRCIVTTIDPDTGEQDLDVLRRIRHRFGNAHRPQLLGHPSRHASASARPSPWNRAMRPLPIPAVGLSARRTPSVRRRRDPAYGR